MNNKNIGAGGIRHDNAHRLAWHIQAFYMSDANVSFGRYLIHLTKGVYLDSSRDIAHSIDTEAFDGYRPML